MKRRFIAMSLVVVFMLGMLWYGVSSRGRSGSSATPAPPEEVAKLRAEDGLDAMDEEAIPEVPDTEGYSVDELVNLWSSGILTKQDIESKAATGEISYEIYEEFLNYMSGDEEFDAMQSEEISNFWDYPELNNVTRDMAITDAISFSEGVAWITVAEQPGIATNNHYIMLINTSGEVLYFTKPETKDYEYTNFHNGVSLLSIDEDTFLVNTEGEAIWSMQDDGIKYFEEIYGSECVESIYLSYGDTYSSREEFNGYFEIRAKINTFEQTGYVETIMKPDGTPLFKPTQIIRSNLDDGACTIYDGNKYMVVNIFTGEITEFPRNDNALGEKYILWGEENQKALQDAPWYNSDLRGFTYDGKNIAIDCSQYRFLQSTPSSFFNRYCVLAISNPDGAPYLTVIDENGNQMFSPIKYPDAYKHYAFGDPCCYGYVSENCFVLTTESSPLYYQAAKTGRIGIYITLEGEVIDSGYDSVCPFSDGYSLVYKDHSYYFLNTAFDDAFPQAGAENADSLMEQPNQSNQVTEKTYITMNNFSIGGKWKSVGSYGFGQAQPGAIVAFDGTNCNFFSPSDTYAFYADGDNYRLECTSFMATSTAAFTVKIIDADHIDVYYGDNITELQKTE